jgi:hypothetical protein
LLGSYSDLTADGRIETGFDFLQVPSTAVVSKSWTGFWIHQTSCENKTVPTLTCGKKVGGEGGEGGWRAKHLSLSSIEVKIEGNCISTLSYIFIE